MGNISISDYNYNVSYTITSDWGIDVSDIDERDFWVLLVPYYFDGTQYNYSFNAAIKPTLCSKMNNTGEQFNDFDHERISKVNSYIPDDWATYNKTYDDPNLYFLDIDYLKYLRDSSSN